MAERPDEALSARPAATSAPEAGKLRRKIWELRTNSRFAYVLQISSRIVTSGLALLWIRLLVGAMGKPLNGLYLAFQSVFSLGGLGDLGMGGAVGIRTGQYLGKGKDGEQELQKFLACARTVFLALTIVCTGAMLLFSRQMPVWLNFPVVSSAGSLTNVFVIGSLMVAGVLLFSYGSNLNYACGNVAWPVLPDFLLLQMALVSHWWLARLHQPLWIQFIPYLMSTVTKVGLMWFYVRKSHPHLSGILPLSFEWRTALGLLEGSFWVYFCCLGNAIYRNTDALVINAGFAPGTLPDYNYNYKFCELMVFVVSTATYVSLPKLTQWMASTDPRDQIRVRVEMRRLNQFQILLGCGAALAYLAFNDIFMKLWWLHKVDPILPAAVPLQIAFALNMAVTACGDTALQMALRSGKRGLRLSGMLIGFTGLLNIALSIVAMFAGSLQGIAMATVLAQSIIMLGSSFYLCRHLRISWLPWAFKGCIFPVLGISFAGWLRMLWPMDSLPHAVLLLGSYATLFGAAAWALGVDTALIKEELKIFQKFFVR